MRAIRDACRGYVATRCKSKNRRTRCVFCPSPGADSLILDCDRIRAVRGIHGVINDCFVIEMHGILHVAVIEFKGGSYSPSHARSQLVAGACFIQDILREARFRGDVRIHLIVVAPSQPNQQQKMLCYNMPSVRGKRLQIHTVRCGARLSQVISGA